MAASPAWWPRTGLNSASMRLSQNRSGCPLSAACFACACRAMDIYIKTHEGWLYLLCRHRPVSPPRGRLVGPALQASPNAYQGGIQECRRNSDITDALKVALEEIGFFLAQGDRRGVVAVDVRGETFSLSRWSGVKAKDVRERIPDADFLPSAQDTKTYIASRMTEKLKTYIREVDDGQKTHISRNRAPAPAPAPAPADEGASWRRAQSRTRPNCRARKA